MEIENMRILAAVVTYNRLELLKECIEHLHEQTYSDFDILIVDNASTDGTSEYLQDNINRLGVMYENTGANLGGAGGFNYAIRKAAEMNYDYVWIMDDDTMVTGEALEHMVEIINASSKEFGFITSNIEWIDGSKCKMNEQKLIGNKSYFSDRVKLCREATFVSVLFPISVVRKVGLPIKEFFIWGDDVEYTRRISKKYPCYYLDDSIVIHKTKNNVGSNISIDDPERISRYEYAYRNEVFIAKKEGIVRILYQTAKVGYHIARVLLKSKNNKMKRIKVILSATLKGVKFNPSIEYV